MSSQGKSHAAARAQRAASYRPRHIPPSSKSGPRNHAVFVPEYFFSELDVCEKGEAKGKAKGCGRWVGVLTRGQDWEEVETGWDTTPSLAQQESWPNDSFQSASTDDAEHSRALVAGRELGDESPQSQLVDPRTMMDTGSGNRSEERDASGEDQWNYGGDVGARVLAWLRKM